VRLHEPDGYQTSVVPTAEARVEAKGRENGDYAYPRIVMDTVWAAQ
jgi:hypothetical protein